MTFDDIVDLAVDGNFEVYIDHRGDLATVKGRDAFEQRLLIRLTERFQPLIGKSSVEDGTIVSLAEDYIERVAQEAGEIENVAAISTELSGEQVDTLGVEVIFDTGEELTFDIEP